MQAEDKGENTGSAPGLPGRFVCHLDLLDWRVQGKARWASVFDQSNGTTKLSLYAGELAPESPHVIDSGQSEAVGYLLAGRGTVVIGGREFDIASGDGFHVRSGETATVHPSRGGPMRLLLAVCPCPERAPWDREVRGFRPPPRAFDGAYPERVVSAGTAEKERAADRWFRVLVGPKSGSDAVTQFIGSIPRSKAPEHYHLYEEVICVLSGEGQIWMGEESAPVGPGSLIFLPREQPHCLECVSDGGMELLGMFYPAGSPAINYSTAQTR